VADEPFSGNPEAIARGAALLKHLVGRIEEVTAAIERAHDGLQFPGGGQFKEAFEQNYVPGATASIEFLRATAALLSGNSDQTKDVAMVFTAVNDQTSSAADSGTGKR